MILSAHQPAYLPWLGYFHKIAISDAFVILDEVQFEKNSFTNRNKIKTSNGSTWVTIPMQMDGHTGKTINDMKIDNRFNWAEKHWKSIYLNYKKAPYFNIYSDFFEDMYKQQWNNLSEITEYMTKYFLKEIGIQTKIYKQSEINTHRKKQELIVEMCNELKSNIFIFGKMGKNYADKSYFDKNNIHIYFQNYEHPVYSQMWGNYIPNMGIIDLLFNVSKNNVLDIIMNNNIKKNEIQKMFE